MKSPFRRQVFSIDHLESTLCFLRSLPRSNCWIPCHSVPPLFSLVGVLWRTKHNTIDAILIQWHANKWQGILQLSHKNITITLEQKVILTHGNNIRKRKTAELQSVLKEFYIFWMDSVVTTRRWYRKALSEIFSSGIHKWRGRYFMYGDIYCTAF